jgi:hypothetical protein
MGRLIDIECLGGPVDGERMKVDAGTAWPGQVLVTVHNVAGRHDYVLARDGGRLVALYRTSLSAQAPQP